MPTVTRTLDARSTDTSVETITALHSELATVGLPVRGAEVSGTPTFGTDTQARVREFQELYRLPETGDVDPTTGGVMSLASLVATEGNRNSLKAKLVAAIDQVPNSPEYNYWLARYAIMAGDYQTPKTLMHLHPDLSNLLTNLGGIFDPGPQPEAPEVPYPENFYSYRQDLVNQTVLDALRGQLQSLTYGDYGASFSPPETIHQGRFPVAVRMAEITVDALTAWQEGNRFAANRELKLAMQSYLRCQALVADYCHVRFIEEQPDPLPDETHLQLTGDTPLQRIQFFLHLRQLDENSHSSFWSVLRWRRNLLSLQELRQEDTEKPIGEDGAFASGPAFLTSFTYHPRVDPNLHFAFTERNQQTRLDVLMVVMATIKVPLALSELNIQLRQLMAAFRGFTDILDAQTAVDVRFRYLCEFIEIPFIRLLTLEALLAKADAEYKAGTVVDPAQPFPDAPIYHSLLAAKTYQDVMTKVAEDGQYAANVSQAREILATAIQQAIQNKDTTSLSFRTLGKNITVPTISGVTAAVPGLDHTLAPHQSIAKIDGQSDPRTSNPRVYAIVLLATAKLEQIKAGFNYLGYSPDYLPPWRFSFLLDRARYFAEHAKNCQRDYLNFLSNAEHEEFQEQSLAQNVELEKSNVKIETARVDQTQAEVNTSQASLALANQQATDAQFRFDDYSEFDSMMKDIEDQSLLVDAESGALNGGGPIGIATGTVLGLERGSVENDKADFQRGLEQRNLYMAITEAHLAAEVATKKLAVDQAGLIVAGLQRQAAILRHEFAIQNLNYLRNQTLNADQWFRIANGIRSVSDTYLRYAMELAFLAQQAYNFEADKRLDVIRFDYDLSDVGAMLAADFLLRDLDSLERDLVVSQQSRQQQIRYVLSMAREFPETLRDLAETGEATFSMRLEQLERRFPGLANLRFSSVDLQPLALMDSSRFSVELTHVGVGMVRLKAQPGTSPLNSTDLAPDGDWLSNVGTDWPVKVHSSGPETAVFSGLSKQEAASLSSITANERGAFEGLPGASAWKIDMSMKENRVVPNSLADVLITFTLSGYYDGTLRDVVEHTPRKPLATTTWISGHESFPDAYYQFNRTGRMDWQITSDFLALQGPLGELQNLGVLCVPSQKRPELGRMMCSFPLEFEVDSTGAIKQLREFPTFSFSTNGLALSVLNIPAGATVTFDFGDGTGLLDSTSLPHTYAKPGRYEVLVRIAVDGRLTEYRAAVVVSRQNTVQLPCIAIPSLQTTVADGKAKIRPSLQVPSGEALAASWRIDGVAPDKGSNPTTFTVDLPEAGKTRRYVLRFTASRPLQARFYSQQRYVPMVLHVLDGLHLATNRTFDVTTGDEITTNLNPFGQHVFGGAALSPTDRWTLEFPPDENPCLVSVSSLDTKQHDLGELADAFLALEYKVKDE
jgi:hypothetical protein